MLHAGALGAGAVAEIPGVAQGRAVDVVAAGAVEHHGLADRDAPRLARDRDRRGVDLDDLLVGREVAGPAAVVLDPQRHDVAPGRCVDVARAGTLAAAAVVEVPQVAGDRPLAGLRAAAIERDGLTGRHHQIRAEDRGRRPLDEDLERQHGAGADLARAIEHAERRLVAAGRRIIVDQRAAAAGRAVAERPFVAQRVAVGIARARGVERDPDAARQQLDVGRRQRAAVGQPEPRRQLERHGAALLVEHRDGDVVGHLLAACQHDRRGPAALLGRHRDHALLPLVLARGGERHRIVGARQLERAVGGIEVADRQRLGIVRYREAQLGDMAGVGHPHGRQEAADLEAVGGEVAALAQAQRHRVEVGVVAGQGLDLQAEHAPPANRLALLGDDREQRLPAAVERGARRHHALAERLAGAQRLGAGLDARRGEGAIGPRAAEQAIAGLGVLGATVDAIVVAAGVGVEDAQIEPLAAALGHAQEDHLAEVGIALPCPGRGAVGHRERRLLRLCRGAAATEHEQRDPAWHEAERSWATPHPESPRRL